MDEDGKDVDPGEYVTFPTYFNFWKREYNNRKLSRLVEDIRKDCYVFANLQRHLVNHGHMKNAADHLFNLLKQEYQKKNIFTVHKLVTKLAMSHLVSVHPTNANDFLNYNKLLYGLYRKLSGQVI